MLAQKAQRIAYIDMNYILENVPEYTEAQTQLNEKVAKWQQNIEKYENEIDELKTELSTEKALLTKDLIEEREEDIAIKELELKTLQAKYFDSNGDLFFYRKQLVKPVQDQVYNSIQEIAKSKQYDFVIDKSSDLIMLYTNEKFDISELVVKNMTRARVKSDLKEKQEEIKAKREAAKESKKLDTDVEERIDKGYSRKEELKKRLDEQRAEKLKKREELKKAIEAKRLERIQKIEDAKKALLEKQQDTTTNKD